MTFRSIDLKYLIDEHGRPCTFTVKSLGTYNVATGSLSGGSTTDYTVNIHFADYNLEDIDGSSVVMGDRKALFPLVDTSGDAIPEPDIGDEISGQGDKVSVVAVQKIMSGTSPVCYICQVRE